MRRGVFVIFALLNFLIPALAQNPVPLVYQPIVPDTVMPGGPGFLLTVNGTGFVSGATVHWNGAALSTTFVSSSQLTATVPASNTAVAGTATITAVNPLPGGGQSNPLFFQVTYPTSVVNFSLSTADVGFPPQTVAVGDFNGDGKQDLAVGSQTTNAIAILLGNGDGTFQSPVQYALTEGYNVQEMLVADFNGDGKQDLAVSLTGPNVIVSILLGNGDGTFQSHIDSPPVPGGVICAADFNGDGHMDLAVVPGNDLTILLGNGDGTFQIISQSLNLSIYDSPPEVVAAGDLNGDGKIDLLIETHFSYHSITATDVWSLLGNGDGTFQTLAAGSGPDNPASIAVADFDGDGKLDLVANGSSSTLYPYGNTTESKILLGKGDGTFQSGQSGNVQGELVAVGDINGDGKLDLAGASTFHLITEAGCACTIPMQSPSVALGNGDGTFTFAGSYMEGIEHAGIALADFNGDGRLDIVTGEPSINAVRILMQLAPVSFSPNSLNFGNQPVGLTTSAKTTVLTNNTGAELNITSIEASGDYALAITSTSCPYSGGTVAAAGTCTIDVTFTPSAVGAQPGTLTVTDNSLPNPQVIQLTGGGATGSVTLSATSLNFGAQLAGTSSSGQTITMSNPATTALNITAITTSALFSETSNCGTSLAGGASCTINVTFSPTNTGGQSGILTVTDSAIGSPHSVSLSGVGTAVTVSPGSLDFGSAEVGSSTASMALTLFNHATSTLTVSSISTSGNFSETNTCGTSVAGGGTCSINVTFTPTAPGPLSGTITIDDSDPASPQTVSLTGAGNGPAVRLSASTLTFPNQFEFTTSSAQTVALTNTGNQALSIATIVSSGDFAQTNECGASVAPSATCVMSVTFTPTATGTRNGAVTITDNALDSPQVVSLVGTSTLGPRATISPSTLTFPVQYVGTSGLPQNVTLTNTGDAVLTISGVETGSSFGQTSGCTTSLQPGIGCTIGVFFDPTASGNITGTLTINDNAVGGPQSVALSGTGQDFSLAPAAGSPTTATVSAGGSATFTVSLTPGGGFNQTVSLTCAGAPLLSTCMPSPGVVTLNPIASTPITVSVTTTASSTGAPRGGLPPWIGARPLMVWWFALLAALGMWAQLVRGRRTARISLPALLIAGLLIATAALPSCGGGGSTPPSVHSGGTPSGTYHLNVTGTFASGSTMLSHNIELILTVK